jgi:hypothetical protein
MAILATPLIAGHMFMATLNPSTRKGLQGMISGFVDRQWAKHHYRRWYRENFEAEGGRPAPAGAPAASASCDSCHLGYPIESLEALVQTIVRGVPLRCPRCHVEMKRISTTLEPEAFHSLLLSLQEQNTPPRGEDAPARRQDAPARVQDSPPQRQVAPPRVRHPVPVSTDPGDD